MNESTKERRLALLLGSLGREAGPELKSRIAEDALAAVRRSKRSTVFKRWMVSGITLAAIALMTAAFPIIATAYQVYRVEGAINDASSAHMVFYDVTPSGAKFSRELWYEKGSWRMEDSKGVQLWQHGLETNYRKATGLMTLETKPGGPFATHMHGFGLSAIAMGFGKPNHSVSIEEVQGQRELTIENPVFGERLRLFAPLGQDLPNRFEAYRRDGSSWRLAQTARFEFNRPVPSTVFQPDWRPARTVNLDEYRVNLGHSLASRARTYSVSGRTMRILDVERNDRGQIFLLLDGAGSPSFLHWLTLKDNRGNEYVRVDAMGSFGSGMSDRQIQTNAGPVRFEWWTPLFDPDPKASELTLTVQHEGRVMLSKRSFKPLGVVTDGIAKFGIDAEIEDVPIYQPLSTLGPNSGPQMDEQQALARARYYRLRTKEAAAKKSTDEDPANYSFAVSDHLDPDSLRKAIGEFQKAIDAITADPEARDQGEIANLDFAIAQTYEDLGDMGSAHEFLHRASELNPSRDWEKEFYRRKHTPGFFISASLG